jgi:toxin ParE1/3/4
VTATVVVQPEAETGLAEAFGWYERRQPGLGHEFLDEIDHVFRRIADRPLLAACVWRDARRALAKRFPYAVLYVARGETVYILAVLHQRRDPRQSPGRIGAFRAPR